jgi:hypothetical protein
MASLQMAFGRYGEKLSKGRIMEFERKKCKKCGTPIYFIKLKSGRFAPVNIGLIKVVKAEGGIITLVTRDGRTLRNPPAGTKGFVSHFATCPSSNHFRRRRVNDRAVSEKGKEAQINAGTTHNTPDDPLHNDDAFDGDI